MGSFVALAPLAGLVALPGQCIHGVEMPLLGGLRKPGSARRGTAAHLGIFVHRGQVAFMGGLAKPVAFLRHVAGPHPEFAHGLDMTSFCRKPESFQRIVPQYRAADAVVADYLDSNVHLQPPDWALFKKPSVDRLSLNCRRASSRNRVGSVRNRLSARPVFQQSEP
jgi:hypothetical protein